MIVQPSSSGVKSVTISIAAGCFPVSYCPELPSFACACLSSSTRCFQLEWKKSGVPPVNCEFILKELEEVEEGIQVNGRCISNIRYAEDTVLLASSEAGLQMLVNIVQISSEKFCLKLNINKTKS